MAHQRPTASDEQHAPAPSTRSTRAGADNATRILVVASESVSAENLRGAVGVAAQDAEVLVVAPALQTSAVRFWMSDADSAIHRAWAVQTNPCANSTPAA